jgi:hypothetical protein
LIEVPGSEIAAAADLEVRAPGATAEARGDA